MREFTIAPNDAGQRLDRWLSKTLPLLPAALRDPCLDTAPRKPSLDELKAILQQVK